MQQKTHIDVLINQFREALLHPISIPMVKAFLDHYSQSDQTAIHSAYRIGVRYYGYETPKQDDEPVHREVVAHINSAECASILFTKRNELSNAFSSFQRCTTQQQRDAF